MSRPDFTAFMAAARADDPHGRRSNSSIEREFEIESLLWEIDFDVQDINDVRHILTRIVRMI